MNTTYSVSFGNQAGYYSEADIQVRLECIAAFQAKPVHSCNPISGIIQGIMKGFAATQFYTYFRDEQEAAEFVRYIAVHHKRSFRPDVLIVFQNARANVKTFYPQYRSLAQAPQAVYASPAPYVSYAPVSQSVYVPGSNVSHVPAIPVAAPGAPHVARLSQKPGVQAQPTNRPGFLPPSQKAPKPAAPNPQQNAGVNVRTTGHPQTTNRPGFGTPAQVAPSLARAAPNPQQASNGQRPQQGRGPQNPGANARTTGRPGAYGY